MAKVAHISKVVDVDKQLADHLRKAEEHMIEAVRLFEKKRGPKRSIDFMDKLVRAQEMVTHVRGIELVRMRGPIKITLAAKK